jgi:hypothetical protein
VHELDPDQGVLGCVERFEPQHRPYHPLHSAMILFHKCVSSGRTNLGDDTKKEESLSLRRCVWV